ncbi:MAG: hypothetical protein ACLR8Y_01975 [Alistipes indistinctus]
MKRYRHGTWFRKAKIIKEYSNLYGKTWDEIELLAAQDRLTEEAKDYYEALKAAKKKGKTCKNSWSSLPKKRAEAFTGIGFDSLVDGIVNGFKEGKRSAADFADDFEELMQDAVLQALKMNALEVPLRQWYEDFANAAEDENGLTAEEIKQLKAKYESIIRSAADQLEQLEGISGVDIETARQQASSNGFQTMSQDTGSELNGRFTAIQEYTANIRDTVNSILLQSGQQLNETINIRDIAIQLNGNVAIIKGHTSHLEEMDDKLGRMVKIMNEKLVGMDTINGKPLSQFGAAMLSGAYAELMTPAPLKSFLENKDRSKDGTDVLVSNPRQDEKEVTLTFFITGSSQAEYISRYNAFLSGAVHRTSLAVC